MIKSLFHSVLLLTFVHFSYGQGNVYDNQLKEVYMPNNGAFVKSAYQRETANLVVDGLLIDELNKKKFIPDDLPIVHSLLSNDPEKLRALGFRSPDSGIDLLESEGTPFHNYIYSHYREQALPLSLWDRIVPFVINGELFSPSTYNQLINVPKDQIQSVTFERWDSPSLSSYPPLAFRAILIKTR